MQNWQTKRKVVITCNKRLAPYLQEETEDCGFTIQRAFSTGVEIQATLQECIRLNLRLRCASQVLFSVKKFRSTKPDDVYHAVVRIPWEEIMPADGYLSVTSTVDHFTVNNNLFINVRIKDAIADRMREKTGERPDSGPELIGTVVHLFWKDEEAEIFLDTSGHTLAKHGYRKIPGKAPMLEALASATVMATGWTAEAPFLNPMCGSGTVAIEAAMIATCRYPGLYRDEYAFMHILGYDEAWYKSELRDIRAAVKEVPGLTIFATDNREDAIDISKVNAEEAGVESLIHFHVCDFAETPVPEKPGVIFLNPEYGERLGDVTELEPVYKRIGDFMKQKCQGYRGFVFTGNPDLAKKIGLSASRKIEFYNAKLDCRLLSYDLYGGTRRKEKPTSPQA